MKKPTIIRYVKIRFLRFFGVVGVFCVALAGCGYQLRADVPDGGSVLGVHHAIIDVTVDNDERFYQTLAQKLKHLGIFINTKTPEATLPDAIYVQTPKVQSYRLVGVLTEIRMVLSATIDYHIHDQVYSMPIQVSRSYQHNHASVTAIDAQANEVLTWLYDDLATRISEQYQALHQKHGH